MASDVAALEARIAALERQIAAMSRRMGAPFALARSTLAPNDAGAVQTVQLRLDALGVRDAVPVLYHYGLTASPPVGADKLVTFIDGDRSKAVAVATGHQEYRLVGLANGEVALYDMLGRFIKLAVGGIVINAAAGPLMIENATTVTAEATLLRCSGDVIDNYATNTHTMAGMRTIYDGHNHNQGNDSHGDTEPPTGVPNQQMT